MALNNKQKDSIFTDLLINTFMSNPQLYDKSNVNYVYTPEKIRILKKLSDYLKTEFKIIKGVTDIVAAWQKLVADFKKADEKQTTGSAPKESDFKYYKDLLFLKPTLQHGNPLSTMKSEKCLPQTATYQNCMPFTYTWPAFFNNMSAPPTTEITGDNYLQNIFQTQAGTSAFTGPYLPASPQHSYWPTMPYPYMPFGLPNNQAAASSSAPSSHPFSTIIGSPPSHPFSTITGAPPSHPFSTITGAPASHPFSTITGPPQTSARPINHPATMVTHPSFVPQPSSSGSCKRRMPELDGFAKKKLKRMNGNDHELKEVSNQIIDTLSNLNEKLEVQPSQSNAPSTEVSTDYSQLLSIAVSKVPPQLQDELMEYLLEGLIEFNEKFQHTNK